MSGNANFPGCIIRDKIHYFPSTISAHAFQFKIFYIDKQSGRKIVFIFPNDGLCVCEVCNSTHTGIYTVIKPYSVSGNTGIPPTMC